MAMHLGSLLGGCGNDLAFANARILCIENDLAEGRDPIPDFAWDLLILLSEAARDDGLSEFDALLGALSPCASALDTETCVSCATALVGALY